jgi:hypothetical protein
VHTVERNKLGEKNMARKVGGLMYLFSCSILYILFYFAGNLESFIQLVSQQD